MVFSVRVYQEMTEYNLKCIRVSSGQQHTSNESADYPLTFLQFAPIGSL